MKRDSFIFFTVFIVLLSSCGKAPYFKSGFDSPVNTNSNGLVIADISRNTSYIYLSGYFSLSEGEAEFRLFNSVCLHF